VRILTKGTGCFISRSEFEERLKHCVTHRELLAAVIAIAGIMIAAVAAMK
jgi:hypothetical protein